MEAKQLQIWAQMLNQEKTPKEIEEAAEYGKVVAWEKSAAETSPETSFETPLTHFKAIKERADQIFKDQLPQQYVCYIECECGETYFYSDALNDKFTMFTCPPCGKSYTKAECRKAWRRTMDEKFKRLVASCSRTGSQAHGQSPAPGE